MKAKKARWYKNQTENDKTKGQNERKRNKEGEGEHGERQKNVLYTGTSSSCSYKVVGMYPGSFYLEEEWPRQAISPLVTNCCMY